MWYNHLNKYLSKEGYENNLIWLCVFVKKFANRYAIVAVYVDDINLIGSPEKLEQTASYLKKEFEVKDLGEQKFCLILQLERNTKCNISP